MNDSLVSPAAHPGRLESAVRFGVPAAVLVAAAVIARLALPGLGDGAEASVTAAALTLDFTVAAPALVYFLLVRTRRVSWIVLVPAFAAGLALAAATIPPSHHATLDVMRFVVVPVELALVLALVLMTREALKRVPPAEGDFVTRFRTVARRVLGKRLPADILATECGVLHHALRRGRAPDGFTLHREVGWTNFAIGFLMVLAVETVAIHFWLASVWSGIAAWTATGLSLYAALWIVGDARALAARPTRIERDRLALRVGLRWESDIPLRMIVAVEPMGPDASTPGPDVLVASLLRKPNVRLRLAEPVEVIGLYGVRKTVCEIRLGVDRSESFRAAMTALA